MSINYFENTQPDVDFEDLREEFDGKLRRELDGKLSKIPETFDEYQWRKNTGSKPIPKAVFELKGEELMGRNGCPIFYRPLKVT